MENRVDEVNYLSLKMRQKFEKFKKGISSKELIRTRFGVT
jgi:hypothetical protein